MKKKHIIGSSILLLVLLLGLSTTSYALSESQVENFVYNYWTIRMNKDSDATKTWIESNISTWQTIANASESYNSFIFGEDINSSGRIYFFWNNNNANLYVATNNQTRITTNTYNWYYYQIGINGQGQNYIYDYTSSTTYRLSDMYANYSYSIRNITNGNGGAVKYSAYSVRPDTWLDGPYQDTLPFTFVPKSADEYADVYYFEDVPLYNASGDDLYIGQLFMPTGTNIIYWTKDNYYYRYNDWNLRQLSTDSLYLQYSTTENDVSVYDVYLQKKYIYENTIYSSVWADNSTEPYTLAIGNFYIKNNYTSVVNGVINPNSTFSGDYKDKYDDDLQNQQDIENIEQAINNTINDTDNIDNLIDESLSGDIDFWGEELGYSPLENPFTTFLLDLLENVYDALTKRGNVQLDFNHHGTTNWYINTDDFITPPSSVKNLVTFLLIFLYIYGNYVFFHYLLSLLETAKIDKAIAALGTDEFYDTDIM